MTIEQQNETSPKFREIEWVSKQVKEELKRFNKEKFYEKNGDEIVYNMDTVKQYLWVLKNKKTWKDLISKNSSVMVMAVQIALYSQNYSFWSIDWILWEKTKTAIRKFQSDNNIQVDTFWKSMPLTIEKILEVISKEDQVEIPQEEKKEAQEIMDEKNVWKKSNEWETSLSEWDLNNWRILDNEKSGDNDEWRNLNQNIIRREFQLNLKKLPGNADIFKDLKEITYAEAVELWKLWWYYVNLSWIKEIEGRTFEALLNFNWKIRLWIDKLTPELADKLEEFDKYIIFSWLENIDNETCKILWKTKWTLDFEVLKSISAENMKELVKKPWWDISLNAIENISPEIAEEMIKFPRNIILDWVKKIDKATAEILSKKSTWVIYLRWLETPLGSEVLDELEKVSLIHINTKNDVLVQIDKYKKQKEIQWKDISPIVLDVLDGKVDKDDLSKLTKLTYDEAEILSKLWWYYVNLSWIKEIEERTFETLLKFNWKIRLWIDKLTPELADKLEEFDKYIIFSWLENIDNETCKILWKTKWTLDFEVLKSISAENMKELVKKPWWDISLNAMENISPEIAEEMIEFPRSIFLNWVKRIDKTTAEILSKKNRWKFCLRWLETPLDDDVLEVISKIPPHRFITNHEVIEQMYKYKKQKEKIEKNN